MEASLLKETQMSNSTRKMALPFPVRNILRKYSPDIQALMVQFLQEHAEKNGSDAIKLEDVGRCFAKALTNLSFESSGFDESDPEIERRAFRQHKDGLSITTERYLEEISSSQ
jgi:hypothetical protein